MATTSAKAALITTTAANAANTASPTLNPAQVKEMADAQAAPLLEKLKANPNNGDLLASVGNLYYDAQQYAVAVDYYQRALTVKPSDAGVRTDMATADWYMGNADLAIVEFSKALSYAPNNPNTLFNRGLVKWKGKRDGAGALADWEKLLATTPNYAGRSQVEQMIAEVQRVQAGTPSSTK
jgi:tetratricopeptide (TPR) repeat protein